MELWSCNACRTSNAAKRDRCFKCKRARPAIVAMAPYSDYGGAPLSLVADASAGFGAGGGAGAGAGTSVDAGAGVVVSSENILASVSASGSAASAAWTEALDFKSRQIYYFNTATGETSWARPAELGATPFASGWFGRGSVSGGDANALLIVSNERWLARPAAVQAAIDPSKLQRAENENEYNIWFGRYIGDAWRGGMGKDPAPTRCHPERDAGWTKATLTERASFCIHFAKGACARGVECTYHHVIPTAADEAATDPARDIFGRERHASHRSDMGGIGSMISTCRTLYVGGLRRPVDMVEMAAEKAAAEAAPAPVAPKGASRGGKGGGGSGVAVATAAPSGPAPALVAVWETLLRAQFDVWGEVENVNVITRLAVAFVRYRCRTGAEFALQSMGNQSLGNGEVLNVRWAYDDPNPAAIAAREAADAAAVTAALLARGVRVHVPAGPAERPKEEAEAELKAEVELLEDADGALPVFYTNVTLPVSSSDVVFVLGPRANEATTEGLSGAPLLASGDKDGVGNGIFSGADAAAFLTVPRPPPLASYESWGGRAAGGGMKRARDVTEG